MRIKKIQLALCTLLLAILQAPSFAATAPGNYKADGPIEITSDSLEVLQQQNKAIFTGRVVAVQGDVRLKSERMTVLYKNSEAKKDTKKSDSAASDVGEKNSIDKIIVEKKVFLTTPEETASGSHGLYDVAGQKILLNDNVVLTRGKNVLKGEKLVYDFVTGKSELKSSGAAKEGQRVKALFVNEKDKKADKKSDTKK